VGVAAGGGSQVLQLPQMAESKGMTKWAAKWMLYKNFDFMHLMEFKLLSQIQGNSINKCDLFHS
jgi:hypothetical protein